MDWIAVLIKGSVIDTQTWPRVLEMYIALFRAFGATELETKLSAAEGLAEEWVSK